MFNSIFDELNEFKYFKKTTASKNPQQQKSITHTAAHLNTSKALTSL